MRGSLRPLSGDPVSWPVTLESADGYLPAIVLRPLRRGDRVAWERLRSANAAWVRPWEPTVPEGPPVRMSHRDYVRHLDGEARSGRSVPFAIEVDGDLAGQMHLSAIHRSSLLSGSVGYWVAREVAGRGVATRSLAMVCDYAFRELGLHRVEVNVRPENERSIAVARHLGFREEGIRRNYLHIDGAWRDHLSFALTTEDLAGETVVSRWSARPGERGRPVRADVPHP